MIQFFDEIISSKIVKQWQRESQVKRASNNKEEKLESATIFGVKKSIVGDFEDWKSPPGKGPGGRGEWGLKTPQGGARVE